MRKVFLSTMAMLEHLQEFQYKSEDFVSTTATAFPMTVVIEENCKCDEELTVMTIVAKNDKTETFSMRNYQKFCEQVEKITEKKRAKVNFIEVSMDNKVTNDSHRVLYQEILKQLGEGDTIYADITYGFKSTPIVIFSVLNQLYKLYDGVDIQCISYGNLYNGTTEPTPEIINITSLFYLNSLSGTLGNMSGQADTVNILDYVMQK